MSSKADAVRTWQELRGHGGNGDQAAWRELVDEGGVLVFASAFWENEANRRQPYERPGLHCGSIRPRGRGARLMMVARCLVYIHCIIAIALAGFALWGIDHYANVGMWRFARLVEWLLRYPGAKFAYPLLSLSCYLFPFVVGLAAGVSKAKPATWRVVAITVADAALSAVQAVALGIVSPIRY
jgi:hypothetical protein